MKKKIDSAYKTKKWIVVTEEGGLQIRIISEYPPKVYEDKKTYSAGAGSNWFNQSK